MLDCIVEDCGVANDCRTNENETAAADEDVRVGTHAVGAVVTVTERRGVGDGGVASARAEGNATCRRGLVEEVLPPGPVPEALHDGGTAEATTFGR